MERVVEPTAAATSKLGAGAQTVRREVVVRLVAPAVECAEGPCGLQVQLADAPVGDAAGLAMLARVAGSSRSALPSLARVRRVARMSRRIVSCIEFSLPSFLDYFLDPCQFLVFFVSLLLFGCIAAPKTRAGSCLPMTRLHWRRAK